MEAHADKGPLASPSNHYSSDVQVQVLVIINGAAKGRGPSESKRLFC
jgi:hypothetical protein